MHNSFRQYLVIVAWTALCGIGSEKNVDKQNTRGKFVVVKTTERQKKRKQIVKRIVSNSYHNIISLKINFLKLCCSNI